MSYPVFYSNRFVHFNNFLKTKRVISINKSTGILTYKPDGFKQIHVSRHESYALESSVKCTSLTRATDLLSYLELSSRKAYSDEFANLLLAHLLNWHNYNAD